MMTILPQLRRHSCATLLVHVVWSTYDREELLPARLDASLADLLARKAQDLDAELIAAGNASDHVHFELHNPRGHVWQEGYWAQSVWPQNASSLTDYVRNQRAHHAENDTSPAWEPDAVE